MPNLKQRSTALVAAIAAGDVDAARAAYHPDAKIWHNFDQIEQTVDQNLATLGWMLKVLPDRRYEDIRRHVIGNTVVQQHVLRGTTATGGVLEMPACIIVSVEDGKITSLAEYLDTAQAAVLRG